MNLNNRQIQGAMKRMGIAQTEIDAKEVIIRLENSIIVIAQPQVLKVNMMGQQTYQISGNAVEKQLNSEPEINDEDILTVMSQTGAKKEDALNAIEEAKGDLASAIMNLTKKNS
jgi:nascent polypeptide-associated complex subunit alpha